jgi:hypothetical protein
MEKRGDQSCGEKVSSSIRACHSIAIDKKWSCPIGGSILYLYTTNQKLLVIATADLLTDSPGTCSERRRSRLVPSRIHGDHLICIEHTWIAIYNGSAPTHDAMIERAIHVHIVTDHRLRIDVVSGLAQNSQVSPSPAQLGVM